MSAPLTLEAKTSKVSKHQADYEISFLDLKSNRFYFNFLKNNFIQKLTPIYGDQNNALKKIITAEDRSTEIMCKNKRPVGVLVYKDSLQSEYGLCDALELKTLYLFHPEEDSRCGFGTLLFDRIDSIAKAKGANCVYCTASSKVPESISCALKNGYRIDRKLSSCGANVTYLLIKRI